MRDSPHSLPEFTIERLSISIPGLKWVEQQISSKPDHKAVILLAFPLTSVVSELNRLAKDHLVVLPAGDSSSDQCASITTVSCINVLLSSILNSYL